MEAKNKQILTKPEIARLKQMTNNLKVGRVLGARVLVKVADPWTEMDEVEKKGVLVIPETVRDANTPLPTTGVVVAVGESIAPDSQGRPVLSEGDMVMFSKFAGSDCYFNEEAFRIMDAKEVLCTLVEVDGPAVMPITS